MTCKVERYIRREIPLLDEGASVVDGARLMAERGVGSLVVTSGGRVSGIFTERDLLARVVGRGHKPEEIKLAEVCSRDPITVSSDTSCLEAVAKMEVHRCRHLVVYRGGEYVGLVKLTDMAHALAQRGRKGRDLLVNVLGTATIGAAVGVIVLLLSQLPTMLQLVDRVSGP